MGDGYTLGKKTKYTLSPCIEINEVNGNQLLLIMINLTSISLANSIKVEALVTSWSGAFRCVKVRL